ncbi:MAG: hypothetical protein WAT93_14090 [Pontixanthobacter sp.]
MSAALALALTAVGPSVSLEAEINCQMLFKGDTLGRIECVAYQLIDGRQLEDDCTFPSAGRFELARGDGVIMTLEPKCTSMLVSAQADGRERNTCHAVLLILDEVNLEWTGAIRAEETTLLEIGPQEDSTYIIRLECSD